MTAQIVTAVLRKVGQWVGLPSRGVAEDFRSLVPSGAAQDLLALNIDMASVMQAGRWRDTRMPMRYRGKGVGFAGSNGASREKSGASVSAGATPTETVRNFVL